MIEFGRKIMKRILINIIWGKDAAFNAVLAIGIISTIALGCACGKDFDLANLAVNRDSAPTAANDSPFSDDSIDDTNDGGLPNDSEIKALVKETTSDFALAVEIEDFSIIHAKSSGDFQTSYTADQMKNAFSTFVTQKKRVLPSLNNAAGATPEFSPDPYIRTENGLSILVATGKFASKPFPVRFEYEYVFRDGEWKMLKLIIRM